MANEKCYPVYFLKGKEAVLRNEALNALVERYTDPAFRDFDLERIDGREATAERVLSALGGVPFAERLAERCDKDRTELLERSARGERDVLLIMTGLPARDARMNAEWTVGNFIDEVSELLRNEISAYSAARRIDVPDNYRPRKLDIPKPQSQPTVPMANTTA